MVRGDNGLSASTLVITKSLSIVAAPGIYASLFGNKTGFTFSPSITSVEINAPGAQVTLDGLTLTPPEGAIGIDVISAGAVNFRNCVIGGLEGGGTGSPGAIGAAIYANAPTVLHVENTWIKNSGFGIYLDGGAQATVDRSEFTNIAAVGVYATTASIPSGSTVAATTAVVRNSTIGGSSQALGIGIEADAEGPTPAAADVEVTGSTISFFNVGLQSNYNPATPGLSNITATNLTVVQDCTGFVQSGPAGTGGPGGSYFNSFGNNSLRDNGVGCLGGDTSGVITRVNQQ